MRGYSFDIAIDIMIIRDHLLLYRYRLRPRMLRDVSNVDMRTRILGEEVASPVCVAATAMQRMAHEDGELATARGEDYDGSTDNDKDYIWYIYM